MNCSLGNVIKINKATDLVDLYIDSGHEWLMEKILSCWKLLSQYLPKEADKHSENYGHLLVIRV